MVEIKTVIRTHKFERDVKAIKDTLTKTRVKKQIKKIIENPDIGKPLRNYLKGERTVYVPPFRIIYAVENCTLYLLRFEHRDKVYKP
jgi:mRNA-degrading endonuclease RelE of RelBE toxin-antitoxin system